MNMNSCILIFKVCMNVLPTFFGLMSSILSFLFLRTPVFSCHHIVEKWLLIFTQGTLVVMAASSPHRLPLSATHNDVLKVFNYMHHYWFPELLLYCSLHLITIIWKKSFFIKYLSFHFYKVIDVTITSTRD